MEVAGVAGRVGRSEDRREQVARLVDSPGVEQQGHTETEDARRSPRARSDLPPEEGVEHAPRIVGVSEVVQDVGLEVELAHLAVRERARRRGPPVGEELRKLGPDPGLLLDGETDGQRLTAAGPVGDVATFEVVDEVGQAIDAHLGVFAGVPGHPLVDPAEGPPVVGEALGVLVEASEEPGEGAQREGDLLGLVHGLHEREASVEAAVDVAERVRQVDGPGQHLDLVAAARLAGRLVQQLVELVHGRSSGQGSSTPSTRSRSARFSRVRSAARSGW